MKSLLIFSLLFLSVRLAAFEWPGGTLSITVTCRGEEVFAGWVPSSPWGTTVWLQDPMLELYTIGGQFVDQRVITGNTAHWYGGTRIATVSFTLPAGSYSLRGEDGTRHIRISGEGYSGFRMRFVDIPEPAAPNQAPTIQWVSAPASVAHQQSYSVSARGSDADGNLTQVNVWKNGQPFASAGGGTGFSGEAGNPTSDNGAATVTFTAQAVDSFGAVSGIVTHSVSIGAPPPTQYTLTTVAGGGGSVSSGGIFTAGTTATVSAVPDANHDFAGWSGDASGMAIPLGVLMDRSKSVQANFSLKQFALTTSATSGGGVTPGGSYPFGTVITVSASPDSVSRFVGWAGDASGSNPSVAVVMSGPRTVQAVFVPKSAQSITFAHPGDRPIGSPPFALGATSSAGLPVGYAVLSGPAVIDGDQLEILGPGPVTVQASQAGDATYLAAPSVTQTFNAVSPVIVKFQAAARTILQGQQADRTTHVVLENP